MSIAVELLLESLQEDDRRFVRGLPLEAETDWPWVEEQLTRALETGDVADCHQELAIIQRIAQACLQQGKKNEECRWLRFLLPLATDVGEPIYQFLCYYRIGCYKRERNACCAAAAQFARAESVAAGGGIDVDDRLLALEPLVDLLKQLNRWENVVKYASVLAELQALRDRERNAASIPAQGWRFASALTDLALAYLHLQEWEAAAHVYAEARMHVSQCSSSPGWQAAIEWSGSLDDSGAFVEAEKALTAMLLLSCESNNTEEYLWLLVALGSSCEQQGKLEQAIENYKVVLRRARGLYYADLESEAHSALARCGETSPYVSPFFISWNALRDWSNGRMLGSGELADMRRTAPRRCEDLMRRLGWTGKAFLCNLFSML